MTQLILRNLALQNDHIEGLGVVMMRFGNILEEVRRKPYDLLDASQTIFERDFLEFNVHISDLETAVQVRALQYCVSMAEDAI